MKRFIYLISPKKIYNNFYKDLNDVLKIKKIKYFQLRIKNKSEREVIRISLRIKKITKKYKVKLIINDDYKIVRKINADGCHLGQSDSAVKLARKTLKKKIIGSTCHNSKTLANKAIRDKAQYIAFGSFFKSKLKPGANKANIDILKWGKKNVKIPIVAIGGITDKNYKKLIKAGANYIAISSFIWDNPFLKPKLAIKKFK